MVFGLASVAVFAQEDSLYTDTVIVQKAPHVITKQVYVNPVTDTSNATRWQLEVSYLIGNVSISPKYASINMKNYSFNLMHFQAYRTFRRWELGLGLGWMTTQFQQESMLKENFHFQKDSSFVRILDSYVQTVGGKDTTIYITEPADTVLQKTSQRTILKSGQVKFSYVQIPFTIGYRIPLWKQRLFFTPRVQLIFGLRTQLKTNFEETMHKFAYTYGLQTDLSYVLFRNVEIKAKANWQSNLSRPFYGEAKAPNWHWLAFGLGLGVRF